MADPYTDDLQDAWTDVLGKRSELQPDKVEELVQLAHDAPRWLKDGENDKFRALLDTLNSQIARTEPPLQSALKIAATVLDALPFEVDDPSYDEEPFAFRSWRTVTRGFEVMDARAQREPGLRVQPRVTRR